MFKPAMFATEEEMKDRFSSGCGSCLPNLYRGFRFATKHKSPWYHFSLFGLMRDPLFIFSPFVSD